jgi:hypothetical protein
MKRGRGFLEETYTSIPEISPRRLIEGLMSRHQRPDGLYTFGLLGSHMGVKLEISEHICVWVGELTYCTCTEYLIILGTIAL